MGARKSPWVQVPDDWLDDKYSRDYSYRAFQEYFGLKVKPEVINEYLIGRSILPTAKIEVVRFSAQEISGKLGIDARIGVTGTTRIGGYGMDTVEIYRTINLADKQCSFDKIGSSTVNLGGFGVEYYRRALPLLEKLGVRKISTSLTTGPEETEKIYQFVGAYVWSHYGYTNTHMAGTLDHYIDYLRNIKKLPISRAEETAISSMARMVNIAEDTRHGERTGEMFLRGIDGNRKPTMSIWWNGVHNNISDRSDTNIEMYELTQYLLRKMK